MTQYDSEHEEEALPQPSFDKEPAGQAISAPCLHFETWNGKRETSKPPLWAVDGNSSRKDPLATFMRSRSLTMSGGPVIQTRQLVSTPVSG